MTHSNTDIRAEINDILGEPSTHSSGRAGLPQTGSITDYTMYFTKDGKKHLIDRLEALISTKIVEELENLRIRISYEPVVNKTERIKIYLKIDDRIAELKGGENG